MLLEPQFDDTVAVDAKNSFGWSWIGELSLWCNDWLDEAVLDCPQCLCSDFIYGYQQV